MARIDRPVGYKVDIIESERGWGSKVDEVLYFDNEAEAREYARAFNARNIARERHNKSVPNWYMRADYRGRF